jgi:Tfp pilus assembly protein PilV
MNRPFTIRIRRGSTVTEALVALMIVTAAVGGLGHLMSASAQQRRAGEARRLALQELANQAERVAALSWDETAPETFKTWTPSPTLAAGALAPQCHVEVADEAGPPVSRRVVLSVAWNAAGGQAVEPVTLTVWKFQEGEAP